MLQCSTCSTSLMHAFWHLLFYGNEKAQETAFLKFFTITPVGLWLRQDVLCAPVGPGRTVRQLRGLCLL